MKVYESEYEAARIALLQEVGAARLGDTLAGSRELGRSLHIGHRHADDRCLWSEQPRRGAGAAPIPLPMNLVLRKTMFDKDNVWRT